MTSNDTSIQDASASSANSTHALCAAAACNIALLSSHCSPSVASTLPPIIAAVNSPDLLVRRTALLALTSAAHSHTSWLNPELTVALMEVLLHHVKLDESLMRQVIISCIFSTRCGGIFHLHSHHDHASGFDGSFQDQR